MVARLVLLVSCLFLGASLVSADLPIHCVRTQVAGTWEFSLSPASSDTPDLCGYRQPDKSKHHLDGSYTYVLDAANKLKVDLDTSSRALATVWGNGTWTMVYDEGFWVTFPQGEFFAFNAYKPKPGTLLTNIKPENYISFCDRTLVGWYRKGDKFGCWRGEQKKAAHPNVKITPIGTNSHEVKFAVVSPDSFPASSSFISSSSSVLAPAAPTAAAAVARHSSPAPSATIASARAMAARALDDIFDPNYSLIEAVNSDPHATWAAAPYAPFLGKKNRDMVKLVGGVTQSAALPSLAPGLAPPAPGTPRARAVPSPELTAEEDALYTSFLETETLVKPSDVAAAAANDDVASFLELDASLSASVDADASAVEAALDAADAAALQRYSQAHGDRARFRPRTIPSVSAADAAAANKTCEYGLPCALDWRSKDGHNWMSTIRNQGSCGSCYAMAFMSALESRARIKLNKPSRHRYSTQHALSCSQYNQGCDGGFPELVGLHVQHFGAVSEKCFPYQAQDGACRASCKGETPEKPIKNTRYIGGYYGNTSEEAMMREIHQGGPVVVAFESPQGLFSYHGGIFTGPKPRAEDQGVAGVAPWQHTNHAVVAVGWGHTMVNGKRQKYWIMRNTWGKHWGEDGYFRIRRGTDECGIESMAVAFDVSDDIL